MKKLFIAGLFLSLSSFAGIETGSYRAVDVETGTIDARLVLRANGAVSFTVKTPDFEMPAPGCDGKYKVSGKEFLADMTCPIAVLPEVSVSIDITGVTPESVRTKEGALVPVVIDAISPEATLFRLKIVESKK